MTLISKTSSKFALNFDNHLQDSLKVADVNCDFSEKRDLRTNRNCSRQHAGLPLRTGNAAIRAAAAREPSGRGISHVPMRGLRSSVEADDLRSPEELPPSFGFVRKL